MNSFYHSTYGRLETVVGVPQAYGDYEVAVKLSGFVEAHRENFYLPLLTIYPSGI